MTETEPVVSDSVIREKTVVAPSVDPSTAVYDRDLVRMMAEVNFINGEVSQSAMKLMNVNPLKGFVYSWVLMEHSM